MIGLKMDSTAIHTKIPGGQTRQLAAIMFADMTGYTANSK